MIAKIINSLDKHFYFAIITLYNVFQVKTLMQSGKIMELLITHAGAKLHSQDITSITVTGLMEDEFVITLTINHPYYLNSHSDVFLVTFTDRLELFNDLDSAVLFAAAIGANCDITIKHAGKTYE